MANNEMNMIFMFYRLCYEPITVTTAWFTPITLDVCRAPGPPPSASLQPLTLDHSRPVRQLTPQPSRSNSHLFPGAPNYTTPD